MVLAAVYSRAAYAYTGRRGLFDSVTQGAFLVQLACGVSAMLMHGLLCPVEAIRKLESPCILYTILVLNARWAGAMVFSLHRAAFDYAEHVDDASNELGPSCFMCAYSRSQGRSKEAAFLDMMCLAPEDLVCAQWRSLGPAFAVARDHVLKWIVVAVRGTLSLKDILTDCAVNSVPFLEGTAHEGFVKTSQKLLEEIEELLRKEMQAHQGYRLVFCGHSMGGAVSAMCVAMLRDKAAKDVARYGQWASQCCAYGIGTPAVLSRNICERLAQSRAAFVVVNAQDWSPRASVSSVSELLDDLVELSLARTMMRMATGAGQELRRPEPEQLEQLPPGVMLQIVPGQDQSLLKASSTDYRHSMPAWPDVAAHIPLAYVEGAWFS
ncbi:DAGLB [Symbiodinium sp. CCMP2592]|nr:DAGLB [Symbiodinium sp. CCMP2592]